MTQLQPFRSTLKGSWCFPRQAGRISLHLWFRLSLSGGMGAYSQKGPAQSRTGRLPLNKVTAEASCHPTSPVSSHTAEIIPSILHARGQALPFENPPLNTQAPLGSLYSQKISGELSQQSPFSALHKGESWHGAG